MRTIPFNEAPDEMDHYIVCKFIGDKGRLPVFGKDLSSYWMNSFTKLPVTREEVEYYNNAASQYSQRVLYEIRFFPEILDPYISYVLSAFLMKIVSLFSQDPSCAVFAARFVSVIFGTLTALLTFFIAKRIFPKDDYLPLLSAVFIGALPQFTFVSSYINQDAFSAFAATLVFFAWLKCLDAWNAKTAAFLGCALGLVVLSKINAYGVLLLNGLFMSIFLRKNLRLWLIAALCVMATAGWFFLSNYFTFGYVWPRYLSVQHLNSLLAVTPEFISQNSMTYYKWEWSFLNLFLNLHFISFWGLFGWMDVTMPANYYFFAKGISLIAFVGFLYGVLKRPPGFFQDKAKKILLFMGALIPIIFFMSLFFAVTDTFQAQGRYFFPAICPISIIFSFGWLSLAKSSHRKRLIFISIATLLVSVNIFSYFISIIGTYYLR